MLSLAICSVCMLSCLFLVPIPCSLFFTHFLPFPSNPFLTETTTDAPTSPQVFPAISSRRTASPSQVSLERVAKLKPFQRLNHFPSMLEICRKTQLSRHMSRMAARLPDEYDFHPVSLNLPDQLDDLIALLKRNKTRLEQGVEGVQTFIIKPSNGTMGRGIHLVQTVGQLSEVDISNCIAQAYIPNPLLLDGFKFDLRIYAMVLSVDPLKVCGGHSSMEMGRHGFLSKLMNCHLRSAT